MKYVIYVWRIYLSCTFLFSFSVDFPDWPHIDEKVNKYTVLHSTKKFLVSFLMNILLYILLKTLYGYILRHILKLLALLIFFTFFLMDSQFKKKSIRSW